VTNWPAPSPPPRAPSSSLAHNPTASGVSRDARRLAGDRRSHASGWTVRWPSPTRSTNASSPRQPHVYDSSASQHGGPYRHSTSVLSKHLQRDRLARRLAIAPPRSPRRASPQDSTTFSPVVRANAVLRMPAWFPCRCSPGVVALALLARDYQEPKRDLYARHPGAAWLHQHGQAGPYLRDRGLEKYGFEPPTRS